MKIEQEIVVPAPKAEVWQFFHDVPSVVECLPGAEITEQDDEGNYRGQLATKLGPIAIKFEGKATVVFDEHASQVTIHGTGVDRKGGSRGEITVVGDISDTDAGTHVGINTDVTLSGSAAQFGRTGLINDISQRMLGEFATCVETKLNATPETAAKTVAAEPQGISIILKSLWARLKRLIAPRRSRAATERTKQDPNQRERE
ncbi:Carbon monoxide dehydrogenase subunit G [Haloechinothrix alba]|uniref:Carbon monoxide dehydrogenase subunit G n=1 Tax=Haloechinothrix alba TaxID=664784 RepID=A0A238Y2S3_9PSEU|nr:SRPBCC family protein [Haloechinothrix alba]SNR65586.1 Carbon monoxide dehydrogenase subunit G [Haloechinothrix alba]